MANFPGWQVSLLRSIGAPATQENLRFLNAWQRAEGGAASFNPLNTTQPAGGASSYNSVGVRNYRNPQQGVKATAATLLNGQYGNIVQLLRSGKASAAQLGTAVAHSPWGTGGGVLRVLGAGPVPGGAAPAPRAGAQASAVAAGLTDKAFKSMAAATLINQSMATAQGRMPDSSGLVALAIARKQLQDQAAAHQQTYGGRTGGGGLTGAPRSVSNVQFLGDLHGENPAFVRKLSQAAAAVGGTKIRITSGYRSPQHNAAVGGVPNSNHTTGHAMDGEVFIPGHGWVPLGVALQHDAPQYGLRSGNVPGFYHGGTDPVHVDDGFNQH